MILSSLVACGASPEALTKTLGGLGLFFSLGFEPVEVSGVGALRARVTYPPENVHRTFREIREMILNADLPERAAERAIRTFRRLTEAEGRLHGKAPEDVAFHEVGAADSIVDTVGSCIALELLEAESVSCGPLPMGGGLAQSAHGPLPVPAPATLEVLKGSRVTWPEVPHEMTTPTGAALMWAFTGGAFTDAAPPMTVGSVGYGAGTARFENRPNVLRAVVGEVEGTGQDLRLLESNVDDAGGEALGSAVELLLGAGAADAWLEPIFMKKGRGAYKVCALVEDERAEALARLLMRETGTLGVRHHPVGRHVAERRVEKVNLPYGECRVKVGSLDGEDFVVSPEHSDAVRLAKETDLPLPRVYADARIAASRPERGG